MTNNQDQDDGEYVFAEAVQILDEDRNYIDGYPVADVDNSGIPSSDNATHTDTAGLRQRRR
jgi:hypothetical protein